MSQVTKDINFSDVWGVRKGINRKWLEDSILRIVFFETLYYEVLRSLRNKQMIKTIIG